jgi:hypothetical protein
VCARLLKNAARPAPQAGQTNPCDQRRSNKNAAQLVSSGKLVWNSLSDRALAIQCPLALGADRQRKAPLYYILTNLGQRDEPFSLQVAQCSWLHVKEPLTGKWCIESVGRRTGRWLTPVAFGRFPEYRRSATVGRQIEQGESQVRSGHSGGGRWIRTSSTRARSIWLSALLGGLCFAIGCGSGRGASGTARYQRRGWAILAAGFGAPHRTAR